ncbi:glycosyltransferase family 1 protein [Sphingobium yanoikuyae]|uniref:glycosyltransferase family 4 protein n=1 Tax=Sphingobium yanoikuyae TaxID=13690 RepID=UPI0028AB1043|nr:glycosyltransferase family 1 protein [Sphingobium yanoikuyae]
MSVKVILSVEALEPRLSGIGRYSWELAQRIGAAPEVDGVRFYRNGDWISDPSRLLVPDGIPRRHKVHRWLRNRTKAVRRLRDRVIAQGHLFHGPNYFLPEIGEGGVVTVHDLSVFHYPETHPAERLRYFEREFAASMARTAHIITDSATTRAEVINFLSLAPERVTAIPLAASPAFTLREAAQIQPALERYALVPQGYALCVSTVEPRKRIPQLLQAWAGLPSSVRARWPLMVTGGAGWLSDDIQALMDRGAREGWVRYLGFVPEEDLPLLYAGAALFVYPSVYEGFGLPPVEAMASGVPTVVANASCLPEVTGGAAMLVEPEDIDDFARRLEQALVDEEWRTSARDAGLAIAGGYSWDRCARETVALYGRVAGR